MTVEQQPPITETSLYAGFDVISRALLRCWKNRTVVIDNGPETISALSSINQNLLARNAVIFFDHHYAFDALPASLALGQTLHNVNGVLIPYAAHLDMRLDPDGRPSFRYRVRTRAFEWLVHSFTKVHPTIRFLPIARAFELENPRLKAFVDHHYPSANLTYLKTFAQVFTQHTERQLCILSPTAGIAFPDKPVLHPQLHRSLELVQTKSRQQLPFFFVGAYPRWDVHRHYLAPLLSKHTVALVGPFSLPVDDYDAACAVVRERLAKLRDAVQFIPPDYSRIQHK